MDVSVFKGKRGNEHPNLKGLIIFIVHVPTI